MVHGSMRHARLGAVTHRVHHAAPGARPTPLGMPDLSMLRPGHRGSPDLQADLTLLSPFRKEKVASPWRRRWSVSLQPSSSAAFNC